VDRDEREAIRADCARYGRSPHSRSIRSTSPLEGAGVLLDRADRVVNRRRVGVVDPLSHLELLRLLVVRSVSAAPTGGRQAGEMEHRRRALNRVVQPFLADGAQDVPREVVVRPADAHAQRLVHDGAAEQRGQLVDVPGTGGVSRAGAVAWLPVRLAAASKHGEHKRDRFCWPLRVGRLGPDF
jgi:hypothetical protein